jgi:GT2 family glycosyltransferase
MLYVMISTRNSQQFTPIAVATLKLHTPLCPGDIVVVIDNDGALPDMDGVHVIRNDRPRSFAENANLAINLSHVTGHDLWLLNNDIAFTPNWLSNSFIDGRSIIVPNCNQYAQYELNGLQLKFAMDLEDLDGRFDTLNHAALTHAMRAQGALYSTSSLIIFYCVYLPYAATKQLGHFDESFGRGGGEDVDYRMRAMDAGIEVKLAYPAYLLHFMGKSTWRSGEVSEETRERELAYRTRFIAKWGMPLAEMFLSGGDKRSVAQRYGVLDSFEQADYPAIFRALRNA